MQTSTSSSPAELHRNTKRKKDYKRVGVNNSKVSMKRSTNSIQSGKMRSSSDALNEEGPPQPMLLPTGRAHDGNIKVNDRKQHPRLRGADLHAVRIGWSGTAQNKPPKAKALPKIQTTVDSDSTVAEDALSPSVGSLSNLSIASSFLAPDFCTTSWSIASHRLLQHQASLLTTAPSPAETRSTPLAHAIAALPS